MKVMTDTRAIRQALTQFLSSVQFKHGKFNTFTVLYIYIVLTKRFFLSEMLTFKYSASPFVQFLFPSIFFIL